MILPKRFIILPFLLTLAQLLPAQFYDTGTDPASIRWKQIRSSNFRVVFPSGHEKQALQTADYLETSFSLLAEVYTLPRRRFKTDVVLHPYSSESNGYVGYAPRRMELFPMPEQNSIPADNLKILALHEAVHVMQFMSLQNGFTGDASRLAGQQVTGLVAAMMPFWFYEGDAVFFETLLSPAGRGSTPSFNRELKALYSSIPGGYSFNKMLLGSYRDYTPNHYMYGYRMLEYSRLTYGNKLWNESLAFTASRPYLLNPLNIHLRRNASLSKKRLFEQTFGDLALLWSTEIQSEAPLKYSPVITNTKDNYINYYSPLYIGADSIIAIKSSLSESSSVVLLTKSGASAKRLAFTGYLPDPSLSTGGNLIAWSQFQPDTRWENRNFQSVYTYNLITGLTQRLTSGTRYTSPSVRPDGSLIAVVENSAENINHIVFIEPANGNELYRVATPGNGFPQRPQWSSDGALLTVILLTDNGEGIYTYSYTEGSWTCNLEPEFVDLHQAVIRNDTLFFISAAGGTDNLFIIDNNHVSRVTRSAFGIGSFSLHGNQILLSEYTHRGFRPVTAEITGEQFNYQSPPVPVSSIPRTPSPETGTAGTTSRQEISDPLPYRKWQNLFNIHSWVPLWLDIDEVSTDPSAISPGFTLFSQNLLSTLITTAGYEYSGGEHRFHTGFTWKGWYPVVNFRSEYGGEPQIIRGTNNSVNPVTVSPALSIRTEVTLPLTFSWGASTQYIRPSFSHRYNNRYIWQQELDMFDYGQSFFTGGIYFSNSRRSSYRDIFPVFAQAFDFARSTAPFDSDLYGPISSLRTAFYFPGIFRNHGLRIRLQTESQLPEKFIQFNRIDFPRGYSGIISEKLRTASADYVFPLAYPDFSVGSLLYIKRFRGGLFYDFSEGTRNRYLAEERYVAGTERFSSAGGELIADFNVLRIPFDISAGARWIYLPAEGISVVEAVFGVDVYGFSLGKGRRERLPWL